MRRTLARPASRLAIAFAFALCGPAFAVEVRSDLPGLRIAASHTLPPPTDPQAFGPGDFCANLAVAPKTAAGKQAARLGWQVTSEETRAGYTAVGIFSRGGDATSGTCLVEDGNVVLFRGAQVVAIVYEPRRGAGEAGSGVIGGVVPALAPDRLRISDFTPVGFEHADLLLGKDSIAVVPVAASETACGGLVLPNLRGMRVPDARKALAPHGWAPAGDASLTADAPLDAAADFRKQGLTEYETCSGTGYGFCALRYRHPTGATLSVTTVGDDGSVSGYTVECPRGRR